ncbi:PHA/PHB synthase family protein [Paucibacter sp. KCTC 42545]|uniref:PHA/PHB synthase family protein n=1 Tax=Paucibacter sp. KCTC 42545 TaxID=1768242 RepID=UPI000733C01B|nr:alpha/beta fold hydrolase [Paucibacter sp. KCTC 42545]ALT75952.1 poly-beta-hydroxybutyrate polymerase [Paucibacter sp. KCTC 42545]
MTEALKSSSPQPERPAVDDIDRTVHAQLARLTMGLSPASMGAAMLDWLGHLALSPGKQQALARQALASLAEGAGNETPVHDRRFAAPEWQRWPFNRLAQNFLRQERWWQAATTGVHGVSPHHEQQAAFLARQWLDMFSPSNFLWTNPEVLATTVKSGGANLLQGAKHQWQDTLQLLTGKQADGAAPFQPGKDVAITPGKVVFRNHLIELIQYAPQTETVFAEPLLIVPPWIMKFYILDLSPADSLVRYMVEQGHSVFIISWRNPGAEDRDLGMDDYLKSGVLAALDAISAIVPERQVQALGYCLGGTLLSIAAAYLARSGDKRLNSLTLLTSEMDFTEPGELSLFIDESQLHLLEDLMADKGYLEGGQMAGAFTMMNARDLLWSRLVNAYLMGKRPAPSDLGAWNADATRMPYRQHSEYLRGLYRDNDLAQGRYQVDGKPVALPDIRLPIFSLGTLRDTVAPWRSVYKIHLLTRGEITFCLSSGGHNVGVVSPPGPGVARSYQLATHSPDANYIDPDSWVASAPAFEGSWWPAWAGWLQQHSSTRVAPPAMGNEAAGYAPLDDAPGRYVLMP